MRQFERFREKIKPTVQNDWAVIHDFLPADIVAELASESQQLWANNDMHPAGIGQGAAHVVREDVRGDQIHWLDENAATPAQTQYWHKMAQLRETLNEELFLSLISLEAHFAVYAPGAFYQKHLDRFAHAGERVISCSFYLNPDWKADYGGHLRLYIEGGHVDILPTAGTLVLFRSDTVHHEVLPATQPRYSLTGWFKRRAL